MWFRFDTEDCWSSVGQLHPKTYSILISLVTHSNIKDLNLYTTIECKCHEILSSVEINS